MDGQRIESFPEHSMMAVYEVCASKAREKFVAIVIELRPLLFVESNNSDRLKP